MGAFVHLDVATRAKLIRVETRNRAGREHPGQRLAASDEYPDISGHTLYGSLRLPAASASWQPGSGEDTQETGQVSRYFSDLFSPAESALLLGAFTTGARSSGRRQRPCASPRSC